MPIGVLSSYLFCFSDLSNFFSESSRTGFLAESVSILLENDLFLALKSR